MSSAVVVKIQRVYAMGRGFMPRTYAISLLEKEKVYGGS